MADLVDPFGRTVRDLRISVTDRCNFRCTYCMPEEGMKWLPREDLLTFEEIERLARVFVERFDVDGIRLTGGEPTVRAHLPVLVQKLARLRMLDGRQPDLSLTTNGATFRLVAHELRDAGLDRVNISLDSLRPERFFAMTRRDEFHRVLDGRSTPVGRGGRTPSWARTRSSTPSPPCTRSSPWSAGARRPPTGGATSTDGATWA